MAETSEAPKEVRDEEFTRPRNKEIAKIRGLMDVPSVRIAKKGDLKSEEMHLREHERLATDEEVDQFWNDVPQRIQAASVGYNVGLQVAQEFNTGVDPDELHNDTILVVDARKTDRKGSLSGFNGGRDEPIVVVASESRDHNFGNEIKGNSLTYVVAHETTQKLVSSNFRRHKDLIRQSEEIEMPMNFLEEAIIEKTTDINLKKADPNGLLSMDTNLPYSQAVEVLDLTCAEVARRLPEKYRDQSAVFKDFQAGVFEKERLGLIFDVVEEAYGRGSAARYIELTSFQPNALDSSLGEPVNAQKLDELKDFVIGKFK